MLKLSRTQTAYVEHINNFKDEDALLLIYTAERIEGSRWPLAKSITFVTPDEFLRDKQLQQIVVGIIMGTIHDPLLENTFFCPVGWSKDGSNNLVLLESIKSKASKNRIGAYVDLPTDENPIRDPNQYLIANLIRLSMAVESGDIPDVRIAREAKSILCGIDEAVTEVK